MRITFKRPGLTRFSRNKKKAILLWIPLAILLSALFAILWLMISICSFASVSSADISAPADAAIVLGAAARGDRPSPVFAERIRHAIDLYRSGAVRFILFTGGAGADETRAEAEVARDYAIIRGVDPGRILVENRSKTTYENLREAKQIIDGRGDLRRILIVSDPLHMKRALTMARHLGLEALPSPTPTTRYRSWQSKTAFLLRETWYYTTNRVRRTFGRER